MTHVIMLVIIDAMIGDEIGIMDELEKSVKKYYFIVNIEQF